MTGARKSSDYEEEPVSKRRRHSQAYESSVSKVSNHDQLEQRLSCSRLYDFPRNPLTGNLNQIRLLQMFHGGNRDQDCLDFRLTVQELNDSAKFTAVSYTWGRHEPFKSILIDDNACMVNQNCHKALTQVYQQWSRERLQSDLVWIDSICINQNDKYEKNQQVSMMGDIYGKATEVLACIGSHLDNSDSVIAAARDTAGFGFACNHEDYLCHDCGVPWIEWVLSLGFDNLQKLCIACQRFGLRDYWTRVWIIQEVAKAASLQILCGDDMIPWQPLSDLGTFLVMDMEEMPSITSKYEQLPSCEMTPMYDVFAARGRSITPGGVFHHYSTSACYDPRDHLYGLLSIITWPEGMEPIAPDYNMTPFKLALHVENYIPFECISDMLASFRLGLDDADMRHLVDHRRFPDVERTARAPEDLEVNFRPANGVETSDLSMCGRLRTNTSGELTASFIDIPDMAGSPVLMFVSSTPDSLQARLTRQLEQSKRYIDSVSSSAGSNHGPKRLMLNSDSIGVACSGARVDDVLFPLPGLARGIYLVLRTNHDDIYDIIGQAVLLPGYGFSPSMDSGNDMQPAPVFEARVELKLSANDALVLFAQDFTGQGDEYDEQSRWERVFTPVTDAPEKAARVSIQASPLVYEEDWKGIAEVKTHWSTELHHRMTAGLDVPGHWLACRPLEVGFRDPLKRDN